MLFNKFFKRRPQSYPQAPRTESEAIAAERAAAAWKALLKRVSLLESELDGLKEQLSTTVSHLHKLRGQVHGPRAHLRAVRESANSIEDVPFGDKASLRRLAGIGVGRYTHPPDPAGNDEKE